MVDIFKSWCKRTKIESLKIKLPKMKKNALQDRCTFRVLLAVHPIHLDPKDLDHY